MKFVIKSMKNCTDLMKSFIGRVQVTFNKSNAKLS